MAEMANGADATNTNGAPDGGADLTALQAELAK